MRKKLIIALTVLLVLAVAVPALAATVSGTTTTDQARELNALQQQMLNLRSQMVDKMVQFGQLTPEQGQQIKAGIQARQQYLQQNPGQFGYGPGFCGGFGWMRGYGGGRGPGGMMRGYWNGYQAPAGNSSSSGS